MTEPTTHKAATHCGPRWDFLFCQTLIISFYVYTVNFAKRKEPEIQQKEKNLKFKVRIYLIKQEHDPQT